MEALLRKDESVKWAIVNKLEKMGCCNLCTLRYLGNTEPYVYRQTETAVMKMLHPKNEGGVKGEIGNGTENGGTEAEIKNEGDSEPAPKLRKRSPCTVCLGLLDESVGTAQTVIDQILKAVKDSDIQTKSYTINLTLPIALQFRAYFVWYTLLDKFPHVYESFKNLKPEGICLKNVYKWICTGRLKNGIDPDSDWITDGCLTVNVTLKYDDEEVECAPLSRYFKGTKSNSVSRGSIDALLKDMSTFEFKRKFGDCPPTASKNVYVEGIACAHVPVFLAGRYNKYSRNVSQTPWIIDGKRFHDGSVEELIAEQCLLTFQAESEKFSASGREDVDVRMLGMGRPFLLELISPKRTLFTQKDINKLRDRINESTKLVHVRDLQLVDRRAANKLKEGEELKRKNYSAFCIIPGVPVTPEIIDKLNNIPVPLVLQQKTPIRVLHRRSLMTRERSIYSIRAEPATKSPYHFKLHVQTQAGTYVKELVHGDLGRTKPSIAQILDCDVDIVALDVEDIEFPWPPHIQD